MEEDSGNAACNEAGEYAYTTRPTLAENTRALTPPGSPNDDSGNGYTNLEVWLQGFAQQAEPGVTTVEMTGGSETIKITTEGSGANILEI